MKVRHRAACVFVAVLLIATAEGVPAASASFPGRDGRIAYTRSPFTDEDQEIYSIKPDGSGRRRLTNNAWGDVEPSWSPSGRRLVFQCNAPFGGTPSHRGGDICLMKRDGTGRRKLTDRRLSDGAPTWAPGGNRIVFIRYFRTDGGFQTDLVTLELKTGAIRRLTRTADNETGPVWSPSGDKIAFVSSRLGGDVFTISPRGSNRRNLTRSSGSESSPSWAPGGRRLVYASFTEAQGQQLYVISSRGGRARRLTSGGETKFSPAWSPEGGHIVFSEGDDLFKMGADGSNVMRLTGNAETRESVEAQADWQPQ